jgi:hypothetical protein
MWNLIFFIWIIGCFINCIILYKTSEDYLKYVDDDLDCFNDLLRSLFIFSSFIGLIIYICFKK